MKSWTAVVIALSLLLATGVRAAGPDDQYLGIYYLIQEADGASSAGKAAEALERYQDALVSLQRLQRTNPDWQVNVVRYRLTYLNNRIALMNAMVNATQPAARPGTNATPVAAATNAPVSDEVAQQLNDLKTQVQRLQSDNSSLQSKLREALAVQPAVADPQELARVEARLRELAKENELLKLSLTETQQKASATASAKQVTELRKEADDLRRKLAEEARRTTALAAEKSELEDRLSRMTGSPRDTNARASVRRKLDETSRALEEQRKQTAQLLKDNKSLEARVKSLEAEAANAAALRAENTLLKQQVAGLKLTSSADMQQRLAAAEAQIASLLSERQILQLERAALENRIEQLQVAMPVTSAAVEPPSVKRLKELTRERDELQKQLAAANKELNSRRSRTSVAKVDEMAAQLATLRARLDVLEAKPIPYSNEELALFRAPSAQLAVVTDAPVKRNAVIPKPPAGTGMLVAEAQRHFMAGDYSRAEDTYRQILRKDEKNVYTLANLAAIQLESGKLDDAEKTVTQALAVAPDDAYSLQTLGYLKFRQGNYDAALDALSRAATANPDSAEVQNYLGVTLSHKGQRTAAETALRRALQLDPSYGSAHNNLAVIYASQEPPAVALARWHYQKALATGHPKNPELEKFFTQQESKPAKP
jgi:Flp pilus assembly protein TadD